MKAPITLLGLLSLATVSFAQGLVHFSNNSGTLISLDGVPMPPSSTREFFFAVFLAPSTTVNGPGQTVSFNDPRFQLVGAYNTNHPTVAGRLVPKNGIDVTSAGGNPYNFGPGSTVDFVVRCWSADMGATWAQALESAYIVHSDGGFASSTVGDNLVLGDGVAIGSTTLFGVGFPQVGGFDVNDGFLDPFPPQLYLSRPLTNQTVIRGSTVRFVFGDWYNVSPPPDHEWYLNGNLIPGATNRYQLVITNVQPSDAGVYGVTWRNYWWTDRTWHSITSSATLTVLLPPPTITSQPASQTAEAGATVRLTVGAAGDQPLIYQWVFNGTNVINGAAGSVLTLNNVGVSQSGSYTAVVTNVGGAVTSAPVVLNVISPIERRLVPGIALNAQPASFLNVEYASVLGAGSDWNAFPAVYFTNSPQYYIDVSSPLPLQRFYRASQGGSSLGIHMIPALTLTGSIGSQVRVDGIKQFGPTDAWFTLNTVTLTNTSQLYFDTSSVDQPARLYRLVPVP